MTNFPAPFPCNTWFFELSTCKIGWGGVKLTTAAQRTLFSAQKWHFQAIFGQKVATLWGGGAEAPIL